MDENVDTDYMDTNDLTQAHAHAGLHSCIFHLPLRMGYRSSVQIICDA